MQNPSALILYTQAKRCRELAAHLSNAADQAALNDYADLLAQQAADLDRPARHGDLAKRVRP